MQIKKKTVSRRRQNMNVMHNTLLKKIKLCLQTEAAILDYFAGLALAAQRAKCPLWTSPTNHSTSAPSWRKKNSTRKSPNSWRPSLTNTTWSRPAVLSRCRHRRHSHGACRTRTRGRTRTPHPANQRRRRCKERWAPWQWRRLW